MAINTMQQLRAHAADHQDIQDRCVGIVELRLKYFDKSAFCRQIQMESWELEEDGTLYRAAKEEPQVRAWYSATDRRGSHHHDALLFPARYLFMPADDIKAELQKRKKEADKEARRLKEEQDRQWQKQHDAWIEEEYAKIQERRSKEQKKGGNNA
jgi:hypothetical protein